MSSCFFSIPEEAPHAQALTKGQMELIWGFSQYQVIDKFLKPAKYRNHANWDTLCYDVFNFQYWGSYFANKMGQKVQWYYFFFLEPWYSF